jgi:hypothetical protein
MSAKYCTDRAQATDVRQGRHAEAGLPAQQEQDIKAYILQQQYLQPAITELRMCTADADAIQRRSYLPCA